VKLYFFIRKITLQDRVIEVRSQSTPGVNEIFYCLQGSGEFIGSKDSLAIGRGMILLNPQGKFRPRSPDFQLGNILFTEDLFTQEVSMERQVLIVLSRIKEYDRHPLYFLLSRIGAERMNLLFENMFWEFKNRYRGYSWAIRLKLIELLITVIRDKRFKIPLDVVKSPENSHIQEVVTFLNREFQNPVTVEDVLQFCPLSRSHFHSLFKQETGKTFVEYLHHIRCREARNQLIFTEKKIIDIAADCGFNNLSHFYHVFKGKTGYSPKQLRLLERG